MKKRLIYPVTLVVLSLFSAAIITTAMATTLASYYKNDKNNANLVKQTTAVEKLTASR